MSHDINWQPLQLTVGATSGMLKVEAPFETPYLAILNKTAARLYVTEGEQIVNPPDSFDIEPNIYLGFPYRANKRYTIFWTSQNPIADGAQNFSMGFASEPIALSGGAMTTGGVASNVQVVGTVTTTIQNTPHTIVDSMPGVVVATDNVGLAKDSTLQGVAKDSTVAKDATLTTISNKVATETTLATVAKDSTVAKDASLQNLPLAATTGLTGNSQQNIGTAATQITIPPNVKTVSIQNMDTANVLYLGDSNVTTSNGFPIYANGGSYSFDVKPGSTFVAYGISTATIKVAVMGVA